MLAPTQAVTLRAFSPPARLGKMSKLQSLSSPREMREPFVATLTRIFHRRWVARATCPFRWATSPAEARRQASRFASLRDDKVPVQAWSASCRPEQAGSLFHPPGGNQYETLGLNTYREGRPTTQAGRLPYLLVYARTIRAARNHRSTNFFQARQASSQSPVFMASLACR